MPNQHLTKPLISMAATLIMCIILSACQNTVAANQTQLSKSWLILEEKMSRLEGKMKKLENRIPKIDQEKVSQIELKAKKLEKLLIGIADSI